MANLNAYVQKSSGVNTHYATLPIIKKASEARQIQTMLVVIAGGVGTLKTTLGCSSKRPIVIDADHRMEYAKLSADSIKVTQWGEVLAVQDPSNQAVFQPYDTIVIDTVGRILEQAIAHFVQQPKLGSKGILTRMGWGVVRQAFKLWLNQLRGMGKDIVLLCHLWTNDEGVSQLDIPGGSNKDILKLADCVGQLYPSQDGGKILDFNQYPTFPYGKNSALLEPALVPSLQRNRYFLADTITRIKEIINRDLAANQEIEAQITTYQTQIEGFTEPEQFTTLLNDVQHQDKSIVVPLKWVMDRESKQRGFQYDTTRQEFIHG